MKKSYHSITVPIRVPVRTRRRSFGVISFALGLGCEDDPPALFVTCGRITVFHLSLRRIHCPPVSTVTQIYKFVAISPFSCSGALVSPQASQCDSTNFLHT